VFRTGIETTETNRNKRLVSDSAETSFGCFDTKQVSEDTLLTCAGIVTVIKALFPCASAKTSPEMTLVFFSILILHYVLYIL
jgi:hypothetical protein